MNLRNSTILILILFFSINSSLSCQNALSLEDIFGTDKYEDKKIENVKWMQDESGFLFTRSVVDNGLLNIVKYDITSGAEELVINSADLIYEGQVIEMSDFQFTDDMGYFLIIGKKVPLWRYSYFAPSYIYNLETKTVRAVSNNEPVRNAVLSPDGRNAGYVKKHDLYITDLVSGMETRITSDGNENILNGEFDYVHEEEFDLNQAWQWSTNGKKLAFWKTDQTHLQEHYIVDESPKYNTVKKIKYTKTGGEICRVEIGVYDLKEKKISFIDFGSNDNIYIPRIFWTNSSDKLYLLRMNRKQNYLELMTADLSSGKAIVILTDEDEAWVDVTDDYFFVNNSQIIYTSELSGFRHIFIYDLSSNKISQVTKGEWEVSEIVSADSNGDRIFFYAKKDGISEQHLYSVSAASGEIQKLSHNPGWYEANFSPDNKYYIEEFSNVATPTITTLRNSEGSLVSTLEDNVIVALNDLNLSFPEFFEIETDDGMNLSAYLMKPVDFDPAKKYPVIVYGYGLPASQTVVNKWRGNRALWHSYLTEKGFIIFSLDNRGSGGKGKMFKNYAYGDFSKWMVHDQIEGAKYLASLSYVDKDRIGFWGWSGGGYSALHLLTRAADYFSVGVAVAPVSDFKLYDNIWTERYMGLPDDNQEGYEKANALNYASMLEGKLLIIHGTADDNVHPQHTYLMAEELQKNNKQFDLMLYPNKRHSIKGKEVRPHLYEKIFDFFMNNL